MRCTNNGLHGSQRRAPAISDDMQYAVPQRMAQRYCVTRERALIGS